MIFTSNEMKYFYSLFLPKTPLGLGVSDIIWLFAVLHKYNAFSRTALREIEYENF